MQMELMAYVVLERDGTGMVIEMDCEVFGTEAKAQAYLDERVKQMADYIDDSTVAHEDDSYYIVSEDGLEWWEAKLVKKEMNL